MTEFIKDLNMQAVVLAGGLGLRMGEFTKEKQKCMIEIDGVPILEHILSSLKDTFGKRVKVIIATGYHSDDIKKHFGNDYQNMKINYVHDDCHLEVKKRLLLVKDIVTKPFLFLAGDILTPSSILEEVEDRFYQEHSQNNNLIGVMAGAKYFSPALTHAILIVDNSHHLRNIRYSSSEDHNSSELRDVQRAFYSPNFLDRIEFSEEKLLSKATLDIFLRDNVDFGVVEFDGLWAHYAEPNDLEKYQDLPFLRKKA